MIRAAIVPANSAATSATFPFAANVRFTAPNQTLRHRPNIVDQAPHPSDKASPCRSGIIRALNTPE